ncbi:DNA (cytosine-5-)-methyltransferase [Mesorhizobium sp. M1A.F.Ca.IN.022.02.1.1]|uniref:DNA (cytosine-5-)-methyltransferase n=1 Tax=Mesorhizobium sp. M1A.F.Ca.IN.022.02.1.1 TaxID=2496766 RepID=UPI000FCC4CD5|nr:DNA (cytosine-5-)-methyltransferase [Mesorhizobium sp. M1A.F.Ca.IN.022.02.1.1]RUV57360.1 DNA (cytosine-5-)-methyltransferase [Mesorhizobium sp. M1A.F.Ca.IN.022.02.1.1]
MTEFSILRQQAGLSVPEAAARTGYAERTVYRWETGEVQPRKAVLDALRAILPIAKLEAPAFTFIDLFAGIGGLRRGFEPIGGKCVFTSEWDTYSQKTYRANFPNDDHEIAGDIRLVTSEEIPPHDVLLAGFPCQPFSIAGVSKKNALNRPHGFACEAQGTLFFDVARIIRDRQPKAFVLENVKNLVNHDKGRTFRVIYEVLTKELGYHVDKRVLDAKSWVPQHRERIFIVGFKEDVGFNFERMIVPDPMKGPKLGAVLHQKGQEPEKAFTENDGRAAQKYTLSAHLWRYLQGYAEKHRAKGNGFGFGLFDENSVARTLSARYYKDGSEILIRQGRGIPRRLTPRECARLMGFDAAGRSPMAIPVSDTQAYKQFGNAVVVPAVEAVARYMQPYLMEAIRPLQLSA